MHELFQYKENHLCENKRTWSHLFNTLRIQYGMILGQMSFHAFNGKKAPATSSVLCVLKLC